MSERGTKTTQNDQIEAPVSRADFELFQAQMVEIIRGSIRELVRMQSEQATGLVLLGQALDGHQRILTALAPSVSASPDAILN